MFRTWYFCFILILLRISYTCILLRIFIWIFPRNINFIFRAIVRWILFWELLCWWTSWKRSFFIIFFFNSFWNKGSCGIIKKILKTIMILYRFLGFLWFSSWIDSYLLFSRLWNRIFEFTILAFKIINWIL